MFDWLCSNVRDDVAFIVTRISKRADIQGESFNASIKLIMTLWMMLVLALMGDILNKIFKIKYETHAYENEFEIEHVFKKWNEKYRDSF